MRLALVCDWYPPRRGGIEAHLEQLAQRLIAAGHDVHVITSTPGDDHRDSAGPHVHRLRNPRLPGAQVVCDPSVVRDIGRILVRQRIDVAHTHVSIVSPVALGGALAAHRHHVAGVITFHSYVPATPVLARLTGLALGASRWTSVMTAVSTHVIREVRAFAPRAAFERLPNAIDEHFWTSTGPAAESARVRFAAALRLHSKKRPLLLVRLAQEIARQMPDLDFVIRLAGSGPLEGAIRRAIDRAGLSSRFELIGWRNQTEVRALLRESDALLCPTLRESFGLTALQARAVGLPVLAMRDSGVSDFIEHETSGLLAGTDADFVAMGVRLAGDEALRARIAAHNRANPPAFTWIRAIAEHERIYAAALERAASSRIV